MLWPKSSSFSSSELLSFAGDTIPVSAEEIKCAGLCYQGQASETGEFFGRGQGTFISHPTGFGAVINSAFSWAESLSISTGSPSQSSRSTFFLGYGLVLFLLPGNSQPAAGSAPVPYIHQLPN